MDRWLMTAMDGTGRDGMDMAELHWLFLVSFGFLLLGLVVLFRFRDSFQGLGDDVRGHRYWPGHDRDVHFYDC